jgi:ABC-type multidrug transport system fused ATPase/permease subunit
VTPDETELMGSTREARARSLRNFGRALSFLWPHRSTLISGLVAALFVGLFYTISLSSAIPLLKVIFSEHESLSDWLNRTTFEVRFAVIAPADLEPDPGGARIDSVRDGSPLLGNIRPGETVRAVRGVELDSYAIYELLAVAQQSESPIDLTIRDKQGADRIERATLPSQPWWAGPIRSVVNLLPAGRDAASRLSTLALVMLIVVVLTVLGGVARFVNEGMVATAVQWSMHDFRSELARRVLRLPLNWHATHPVGDTLARFATDLSKIEVGINTLFGKTIREPIKAIGVLLLALAIDWKMLVVTLIALPIGGIAIRTFGRLIKRAQKRASESWGRLLDHLGDRLVGIRIVKASNMESAEAANFEHEGRELTRAQRNIELVDAATNPTLEVLAMIAVAGFVLFGGQRVFNDELEPHLFFAAVVCLAGVFDPVRKLGNVNNRLQAADASARRLFELMDLAAEEPVEQSDRGRDLAPFRSTIEFAGISFAYPGERQQTVLRDVNLLIRQGQVVAIVGPNGSGKTTLVSLLMRFYHPTRGRILIDGVDIETVTLNSLRRQIGLVTQESIIFTDTVRHNIAYGVPEATETEIRRAADLAHVTEFLHVLQTNKDENGACGLDAMISGRTLSGGQRQRIALARAILRNPPILILDEATSQVDSESEQRIQQALEDVMRGRTTFIIAHRFSTIAPADCIVVLEAGRVVGVGRHDELLKDCPLYENLCRTQFAYDPD